MKRYIRCTQVNKAASTPSQKRGYNAAKHYIRKYRKAMEVLAR